MDALVALQYRSLLAVLAGALVVSIVTARLLRRPVADEPARPAEDPHAAMLGMLVGLAAVCLVLVVAVPVLLILRYFPHWRVAAIAAAGLLVMLPPLAYAWRARARS